MGMCDLAENSLNHSNVTALLRNSLLFRARARVRARTRLFSAT